MDEILTPRLRLRRAHDGDLQAMHAILGHAGAMRYWSSEPHTDLEQTREWLAGMIASPPRESDDFILEHGGQVIGKAGCWRVPEIGFILHPDYWGQGLAFEALSAIIPHVFARFPIEAIEADVDPRNAGSLGLLRKLGFAEMRRARMTWNIGGQWCDSVYLSLARDRGAPDSPA